MQRLIDANALDEKLESLKQRYAAQGRSQVADDYNFVQTVLSTAPTIDAVPVVHGWWIEREGYNFDKYYDCSACGESFCFIEGEPGDNFYYYCSNCGAKMDLEVDGDG